MRIYIEEIKKGIVNKKDKKFLKNLIFRRSKIILKKCKFNNHNSKIQNIKKTKIKILIIIKNHSF